MAGSIRPLCSYMGNKIDIADWIVPMFPRHKRYVEVFGGTGAVLLNKPKSPVEIYNDKNIYMSNLFESIVVFRDEFIKRVSEWNISEVRYDNYFENHDVTPETFPCLESALKYYYILKLCAFGKYIGGFYANMDKSGESYFQKSVKDIETFYRRFKGVLVYSRDFERIIKNTDTEDTLFYLDPPYKNTESYYEHVVGKFDDDDHVRLRDALSHIKGMFYLSYEDNDFIKDLYKDFTILDQNKHRPGKGTSAKEIIITNKFPDHNFLFSQEEMMG